VGADELATQRDRRTAVLARRPAPAGFDGIAWIDAGRTPEQYGHELYAHLRRLDAAGARAIWVEAPPDEPAWEAVRDRLQRAATRDGDEVVEGP
jgi:L-threonylcarbamoyladenylate synthase